MFVIQHNLLGFLNPEWQLNKNNYFFISVIKHSTCLILYYCEIVNTFQKLSLTNN